MDGYYSAALLARICAFAEMIAPGAESTQITRDGTAPSDAFECEIFTARNHFTLTSCRRFGADLHPDVSTRAKSAPFFSPRWKRPLNIARTHYAPPLRRRATERDARTHTTMAVSVRCGG